MVGLDRKSCVPCRGGVEPLKGEKLSAYAALLDRQWRVIDEHHLHREYRFPNFRQALDFVNKVGALAEAEGHHPDLHLGYGMVRITLWTHKIDGLHENDFILASKIDRL
ncbi:MAG: 4a-hydroxytetrahydrobiopterin dehydratase [Phycisphaerales bacterium]|nr:MAG: 4a-hydroxytetrahydrobiopterin dehydratase [Phycisphaerales bacterium]